MIPPFSKIFSGVLLQMSSFTCLWYSSKHPQQTLRVPVSKLNILSFLKSARLSTKKSEVSKVMTSEVNCQWIILISYARVLKKFGKSVRNLSNFLCVVIFFWYVMKNCSSTKYIYDISTRIVSKTYSSAAIRYHTLGL